jgi:HPr kinase/phosphorylase
MTAPLPPPGKQLTVADVFDTKQATLGLEVLTSRASLERVVEDPDLSSPGLALTGFIQRFTAGRMQVFGETEMTYLSSLSEAEAAERLRGLFQFSIPALFVTKNLEVPKALIDLADEAGIPILRSALTTKGFYRRIKPFLESALAPTLSLHGSLADVYGVGLLFVGSSGVGKSECVLDLVERGHRLVADDLVLASRRGTDVLIGRAHPLQGHHMEIRGIGIIDVQMLFGVRAIRQQKRIEVLVQLEHWDENHTYTRTGLETETVDILGVPIPKVTVPLNPGKNITVISEVVAMNHLLHYAGHDSARAFDQHLRAYLEQDYE